MIIRYKNIHSDLELLSSDHSDLKVDSTKAKIYENFANYFNTIKANNEGFTMLKYSCKGLQKSINQLER